MEPLLQKDVVIMKKASSKISGQSMENVTIWKILYWEVVLANCRGCCHLNIANSIKPHISLNPISQVNSEKFHMLSMLELYLQRFHVSSISNSIDIFRGRKLRADE